MKLVVQIPCLNEAETLPLTVAALPATIPGITEIAVLVIDDGSDDGTAAVAEGLGVARVLRLPRTVGLARAFAAGLEAALAMGADVIVNTDGDNQYRGADLPALVAPVVDGWADVVVGDRRVGSNAHFSLAKRLLQRLGSQVVRWASGTEVPDAASGFRAFSRAAAGRIVVFSDFSYTIETLIQAGRSGMTVASVPVGTNPPTRPSRLFRSTPEYVLRQAAIILRVYARYRPLATFLTAAVPCLALGGALGLRFVWYHLTLDDAGHTQSLILAAVLVIAGLLLASAGLLADLLGTNRRLLEEILYRQRDS